MIESTATESRRVVLTIRRGALESLITNCKDVEVLVIDQDTEGMDDRELSHDVDGNPFCALETCGRFDPVAVEQAFRYEPPQEA